MDVDGTLTDGSVTLLSQSDGSALEIKTFDAHDGQGLTLAATAGIRTGVITGRASAALRRRCKELDIEFVYEKQGHKIAAYEDVLRKTGAQPISQPKPTAAKAPPANSWKSSSNPKASGKK